jgi:hypothetical protein
MGDFGLKMQVAQELSSDGAIRVRQTIAIAGSK